MTNLSNSLYKKLFITIGLLLIYRLGSYIPIFGINILSDDINSTNNNFILELLNSLSGGSFSRMSIFTLAIMPYITASIIFQLLTMSYKPLENLRKEGQVGKLKINKWTKYLTLVISSFQAYGLITYIAIQFEPLDAIIVSIGIFKILGVITIVAGTFAVLWLSDMISKYGFGNGSSLIIFIGIISSFPSAVISFFALLRSGSLSFISFFVVIVILQSLIVCILYFEQSQRKVSVYYPKRQIGTKLFSSDSTHIPLKFNTAGVIPPIFASTLLTFGVSIVNFFDSKDLNIDFIGKFINYFKQSQLLYSLFYILLIVFFSFFYTSAVFNSEEVAKNLKKHGAYILGKKPGDQTAAFLDYVLLRLTAIGSLYLSFVCVVPELILSRYSLSLSFGGTSLLIVVNVILDTVSQLQSYAFSEKYDVIMKKNKIKNIR